MTASVRAALVAAVLLLAPPAGAQLARAVDVMEADNPPLVLRDGPRLVRQLNRSWAEVAGQFSLPDSGAVVDGRGRLRWLLPYYAVDAYEAVVTGGRVQVVRLDFSADGPDFSGYAERLAERHGPPPADGYYRADVIDAPFDLAVRPGENLLVFRASGERTVPPEAVLPVQFRVAEPDEPAEPEPPPRDTTQVFTEVDEGPEIVGGLDALAKNVELPESLARARGEVMVQFVIHLDGWTSGHVVVESSDPRLDDAAIDAVRKTRFWPGHVDGLPVRTLIRAPVRIGR